MNERTRDKSLKKFVAYYRVSTDKQGVSGLGLEAQRDAVMRFLSGEPGELINEYTEIESGAEKKRPELLRALAECKRTKSVLVIAKLDRLARNVHVISGLIESGVEFLAVDNPHATKLMLHLLAAFAEHEREQISSRTKAALGAAKRRGVRLGTAGALRAKKNRDAADIFARTLVPVITELHARGFRTASDIANELNKKHTPTWHNRKWHPATVCRLLKRVKLIGVNTKPVHSMNRTSSHCEL